MQFSVRERVGIFLVLAVGLLSLGMWQSFTISVAGVGEYAALKTLVWISLLAAVFFLGAVIWDNHFFQSIGPVLVFLPGLLFILTIYQLVFSVIAIFFVWLGVRAIEREIDDRLRFHFFRNVRSGQFLFVFSLSLALSSGFFSLQRDATWETMISRLGLGDGASSLVLKTAGFMYPELKKAADEKMTVDQFLVSMQEIQGTLSPQTSGFSGVSGVPLALVESLAKSSRDLYLHSGRDQLAKLIGKPVNGSEMITDIFTAALRGKIIMMLSSIAPADHAMPQVIPFLVSLFMFLTFLPIGSFFGAFWIFLAWILFFLCRMAGWIRVETIACDQEVLAH